MIERSTFVRGLALLACATVVALLSRSPPAAHAQAGACTQSCQAAYAKCYRDSGSNRRVCEAQLQQCLSGCISRRQN